MTMSSVTAGWFLVLGFSTALACGKQGTGAPADGGGGTGGAASDAGFACGDASCSVAQEFCRDLSSRGGNTGTGSDNTMHTLSCVPFGDCAAHDCSCVPPLFGYLCEECSQRDGGGTLAGCGKI
jgi:hypothetical protein